jgi:ligand-binding sensor domain-containing protein
MMKYAHVYALLLMFILYNPCKGQDKTDLPKDTIKSQTKDVITSTLPNSITRTIKQDRKGNSWIATFGGVFRYDGKSFTNVTSKESKARFWSVLEDRNENFWFSSIGSGVYYYDGKSFRNFTTKDGLASDQVTDIYEDKAGNIWFGTEGTEGGASRYDGKSFRNFTRKDGLTSNNIHSILEDKTGKFWFGTEGELCLYDGKTFTTFTEKHLTNVRSIIEDKKGNIWLGGKEGLWRYDGSTFTNFTQHFVGYVYEDTKGNIWTSSRMDTGLGEKLSWLLSRYDEKSLSNIKPTVTEINPEVGMLFGISEAADGSIWFGSGGVYRYDGTTITDFKDKQDQK